MQLNTLKPRTKNKKVMVVGRGGKRGKTSGKGTKGQNARAGRKKRPELRDFIKRLPKLRGRGVNQFKSFAAKVVAVNLGDIELVFKAGETVTPATLVEKFVVEKVNGVIPEVKILSMGDITKKVTISGCLVSAGAKAKVEKAGGLVQ